MVTANAGKGTQGGVSKPNVTQAPAATTSNGHTNAVASTSNLSAQPVYKSRPTSPAVPIATEPGIGDEQDPDDYVIPSGSKCKRQGCKSVYSADMQRSAEECSYHPQPAIFHEGSKGYVVCVC